MSTWYERGVFYHMYPPGMTGAPKHNDATEVTSRLEELGKWTSHIRSLSVDAIYIGPPFGSTSHGYDTRDYKLVDRRLGDNGSFRKFVDQCHQEGVKVAADGVFNHARCEFLAFKDIQKKRWGSLYKDRYKKMNFDWQSPCGDSFEYEAWQRHFELPHLNLSNPDVKSYLFDAIRFWIDEFDANGTRLDCVSALDFSFMREMCSQTEAIEEDSRLMGEVIYRDYSHWINNKVLHSITSYELHKSLYSGFSDHNLFEIAHNVRRLEAIRHQLYTFTDNHGEDRTAIKFKLREHLFPIYICLFTLPGVLPIYYDGEWGVKGKRTNTSDEVLRPAIPIEQGGELHCELTGLIAQLGQICSQQELLHTGRCQESPLINRQYAFARYGEDSVIITAVNSDDEPAELVIPVPFQVDEVVNLLEPAGRLPISDGKAHVRLKGDWRAVPKLKGEN